MRARSWFALGGAVALCLVVVPAFGQQPRGGGFGGFGGGFGGGGALALLANEKVIAELELVDDQVAECKAIREKAAEEMQSLFGRGGGERPSREEIQEKLKAFNETTQKKIDKILLPNQAKRLKQLEFQQQARGSVTSNAVLEALKVDDEQKETLTAKAKEVNDALAKKIAKLRADAQEEMLNSFTAGQRATYKELAGEPFDFGPQGGFGGGGFGGAGGRGGQPGAPGGAGGRGGRGGQGGARPARPE